MYRKWLAVSILATASLALPARSQPAAPASPASNVQNDFARMFGMHQPLAAGGPETDAVALSAQDIRTAVPSTLDAYRANLDADPLLQYLRDHGGPELFHLLLWNKFALDLVSIDHTSQGLIGMPEATYAEQFGPPRSSRALAIVHLAMFEAVDAITHRYQSWHPAGAATDIGAQILAAVHPMAGGPTVAQASIPAAIARAAHDTLIKLYPNKVAIVEADFLKTTVLTDSATVQGSMERSARYGLGSSIGAAAAAAVLAARSADCSTETAPTTGACPANVEPVLPANSLNLEPPVSAFVSGPLGSFGWIADPVSQNGHALGGYWGDVIPFATQPHQFVHRNGLTNSYLIIGSAHTSPSATAPDFLASLDNHAYGAKLCDTHIAKLPKPGQTAACGDTLYAKYGVRDYGGLKTNAAVNTLLKPLTKGERWSSYTDRDADPADLTFRANFWGYEGTALLCAPPRLYNMVATSYALAKGPHQITDVTDMARYLALVNMALADAGIIAWDAKYTFLVARPVTYIRDTTPDTVRHGEPDAHWTPLGLVASNGAQYAQTPPFPAYPSGHAVFGGALFAMIGHVTNASPADFKDEHTAFNFTSDEYNGVNQGPNGKPRRLRPITFRSLEAAQWENAESRIWLGVHWQKDADDGIALGTEISDTIFATTLRPIGPATAGPK